MSAPAPAAASSSGGAHVSTGAAASAGKRKTYGERKQLAKAKRRKAAEAEAASEKGEKGDDDSSSDSSDDDSSDDEDASARAARAVAKAVNTGHLKNVPMILITCDAGKEQLCKKEMMAWLIDFADRTYPRAAPAEQPTTVADAPSVSGGLAAELALLKAESAAAMSSATTSNAASSRALGLRFKVVPDMSIFRGLVLIAILDPLLPVVELCEGMLAEVRETKTFRTRFSVHLHPYVQTSYSEMASLFKMARLIIPSSFANILASTDPALQAKRKFSIEFIRRGNHSQMDRNKIIDTLAALVPKAPVAAPPAASVEGEGEAQAVAPAAPAGPTDGFSVDLKNPDIVILVEILGRTTGLAVYTNYFAYSKYNIRTLFEQVHGFAQEAMKKDPADQAAAAAAGQKKRAIATEQKERAEAKKKAAAEAAAAAAQPQEQKAEETLTPAATAMEVTPAQ